MGRLGSALWFLGWGIRLYERRGYGQKEVIEWIVEVEMYQRAAVRSKKFVPSWVSS